MNSCNSLFHFFVETKPDSENNHSDAADVEGVCKHTRATLASIGNFEPLLPGLVNYSTQVTITWHA